MYFSKPSVEGKTHTPTREAVAQGATYLAGLPGPNPKVMLLATDGEPNCMAGWKSEESAGKHDSQASIQAVADAAALGIPVYVVGVATSETDTTETLNAMAVAGLTALDHPLLKYYAVDTSEDLATAMQSISAQAAACTFTLDSEPPVPDNVAVEGDGLRIAQDPNNGWGYGPNHTTILLHGSACESVKGGSVASVKILFGCPGRPDQDPKATPPKPTARASSATFR